MEKTNRLLQILIILFVAFMFVSIGWLTPALYATTVPEDNYITVHKFSAQDATTSTDAHYICFDRTIETGAVGNVYIELILEGDDGTTYEIRTTKMERFFQSGHQTVVTPIDLPGGLEEGTYRYDMIINFQLADGRVDRQFGYESEPFRISDDVNQTSQLEFAETCG